MRIAVGGFLHESHSFAPRPTAYADFLTPGGYPLLVRGAAMLPAVRGCACAVAGAVAMAEAAEAEIVPLLWCMASPAGPVQDEAFERIAAGLCAELSEAMPLDGVYLDLHGAAMSDRFPDAEGELLRRVRAIVGSTPVTASLDPHANLTAAMVAATDALSPYRTYPHVDMRDAGARAMALLLRLAAGETLAKSFRQLDYWMPITSQCTMTEPMTGIMDDRAAVAVLTGAAEIAWCFGFPYADFADCGPAFATYAATQAQADAAAGLFLSSLEQNEAAFQSSVVPAADAVAEAVAFAGRRPVIIADTQDNPGGGGHGDTTGLLAELVRQGATNAVVCLINDAESAAACHAAGPGRVALSLGGKSDGSPFAADAAVLRLSDGRFALTGPMGAGNEADLGPSALIDVSGVRVIVVSRKMQAYDQAILRHLGVEPSSVGILALKSSVHFRADFAPLAERIIVAAAPGPVTADPSLLPFRHVRPGVRKRASSVGHSKPVSLTD